MFSSPKEFPDKRHHITGLRRREKPRRAPRLPGSGTLATELDRLRLIDEYRFLVHPRIAGHGPTLYQSGLRSTRRLELVSAEPLRSGAIACTTGARADSQQPHRARLAGQHQVSLCPGALT